MPEPLNDVAVDSQTVTEILPTEIQPVETAAVIQSPLEDAKSAFSKFVAFVEHGIENLGSEAEAELVTLAKKYL